MKNKNLIILLAFAILIIAGVYNNIVSVETLSKYGSVGAEVRQIQTRLKNWGYNVGNVDGIYKQKTQNAVRQFQKNNGLSVDGIAGPQTLKTMGINSSSSGSNNENDVKLLARIINAEGRGEVYSGQVAIGAVVLNRVKHPSFPNTLAGVIYQPGAFTAIVDNQWNAAMTDTPYKAAKDAMNGNDPTNGAIYYYNPAKTTNKWIYSRPVVCKIGKHVFAK